MIAEGAPIGRALPKELLEAAFAKGPGVGDRRAVSSWRQTLQSLGCVEMLGNGDASKWFLLRSPEETFCSEDVLELAREDGLLSAVAD